MNGTMSLAAFCLLAPLVMSLADDGKVHGHLDGQVLAGGSGCVVIFAPDGKELWRRKAGIVHDVWRLPNGNVLYADGRVVEVDPRTDEVVFQYRAEFEEGGGVYSCQRLADGMTLVAENSTGRLLEVDETGKVHFELAIEGSVKGDHHNLRIARKLDNGNYLVCLSGRKLVREYTPKGEVVLELPAENIAFSAARLPSGNTILGHLDHLTEFDAAGKKVWEFSNQDAKGVRITNMCGVHALANGNLVVGIYTADTGEDGASVLEINRRKEVVWRYTNPAQPHMLSAQKLTADGKVLAERTIH